jgi:hypothetical protein
MATAWAATARPLLAVTIAAFGLFLWAVYEWVDIWLDGFALRWTRAPEPGGEAVRLSRS